MPDFVKVSPRGLVPAIREADGKTAVWESAVVVEFLAEAYPGQLSGLMPKEPAHRALVRILVDPKGLLYLPHGARCGNADHRTGHLYDECRALAAAMAPNGKPYYRVMDSPDTKVDALALREIGKQLLQEDGPYILGKDFTAVDVALAPFWPRIHWIGSYYRPQLDFVATEDPALARLEAWWEAVSQRPSVQSTLVSRDPSRGKLMATTHVTRPLAILRKPCKPL